MQKTLVNPSLHWRSRRGLQSVHRVSDVQIRHFLIERFRQEGDFMFAGLKGLSTLTPRETACSGVRTVSSATSEKLRSRYILIERLGEW